MIGALRLTNREQRVVWTRFTFIRRLFYFYVFLYLIQRCEPDARNFGKINAKIDCGALLGIYFLLTNKCTLSRQTGPKLLSVAADNKVQHVQGGSRFR
jgi:hypothetical protein